MNFLSNYWDFLWLAGIISLAFPILGPWLGILIASGLEHASGVALAGPMSSQSVYLPRWLCTKELLAHCLG